MLNCFNSTSNRLAKRKLPPLCFWKQRFYRQSG